MLLFNWIPLWKTQPDAPVGSQRKVQSLRIAERPTSEGWPCSHSLIQPGAQALLQKYRGNHQAGNRPLPLSWLLSRRHYESCFGNYYYEDPGYSIFNVSIHEGDLMERVLEFMLEIRSEVKHPDMDKIIERISEALPEIPSAEEPGPGFDDLKKPASFKSTPGPLKKSVDFGESLEADDDIFQEEQLMKEPDTPDKLQWSLILDLI